jgi:hypothetical protein
MMRLGSAQQLLKVGTLRSLTHTSLAVAKAR